MQQTYLRGFLLLALALVLGFALMGFEMLGSRYLYPYFGGGINTWASLIATVLVALMLGYLLGGALVDRTMSPRLCGVLLAVAGAYLFTIPLWVDPLFAWMLTSVGDGMAGIILAATILLLLPLTLMSVFTPFAVRLLLTSVTVGGRLVGFVYGVSTIGNVLGTLVTTFVLVPSFGSRALTMVFAAVTIACGVVMMLCDRFLRGRTAMSLRPAGACARCCSPAGAGAEPAVVASGSYPEGLLWHGGRMYFTEMGADRVNVIEDGKPREFWRDPAAVRPRSRRSGRAASLVTCHLGRQVVEVSANGVTGRRFRTAAERQPAAGPQCRR